jgi:hypothetical protein
MLPMLQTQEAVRVAAANIRRLRGRVNLPFAIETPVNYLRQSEHELSDGQFIAQVTHQADCGILLDIHNLWCNEQNGRQPVMEVLDELDLERVWEIHLAAGRKLNGYWVDSHSGLIQEPVWKLAGEVLPRLPNVKAIIFESMPEYLWQQEVTPEQIRDEMSRLHHVWEQRGQDAAPAGSASRQPHHGTAPVSPSQWASQLGHRVAYGADDGGSVPHDPGIEIYRLLIRSVRGGVLTDSLRLSYRLLVLTCGSNEADQILDRYFVETPVQQVAMDEVRQFAAWVRETELGVQHLAEVARFEVASFEVHETGSSRTVEFRFAPLPLLEALGAGHLPEHLQEGEYSLEITPDPQNPALSPL